MSYQQQDENIIDGFESSEEDEDGSSLHFGDDFYNFLDNFEVLT